MIWALCGGRRAACFVLFLLLIAGLTGCASVEKRFQRAAEAELRGDYTAALSTYEDLLERLPAASRPQRAVAWVKAGECLWRLDRPTEAFRAFEQAIATDPSNVTAHLRVAELFAPTMPDRALVEARIVIGLDSKNAEAYSVMGTAYNAAGQAGLARMSYQRALELDPRHTSYAIALADAYYRELDVTNARATLRRAASNSREALPWLALGRMEEQEGDAAAAEEAYRNALAAENTAETNLRLAQFLQRNARIDEAEKILKRADALQPWLPTALPDFELQSGRVLNAVQAYTSALRLGGPAPAEGLRMQRGLLAARVVEADLSLESPDAPQLARRHLEEFRADLDRVTALVLQAEISLKEGDVPSARAAATSAVAQSGDSAAAHYVLGVVHQRAGDMGEAVTEWGRAVARDPNLVPARLALAGEELRAGDAASAEEHVASVLREEPANVRALCLFARVLVRQRRFDSAANIARRAVAADGGDAEPRIVQGEIALARRDPGAALLAYEQAVLLAPRSHAALDGLVRVYRHGRVTRPMIERMEQVAGRAPRSAALMEIAGRLYRDRGWNQDAERAFQAALAIDRERPAAATELAKTYAESGALQQAESSLAHSGADAALLLRAFDAEQRNDAPLAIDQYETAIRRGEQTGIAANNLAWLYARQGKNLDRALELAQQALSAAPADPRVLDTVGFVRLQRREYSEAVQVLKRALELAKLPSAGDPQLAAATRLHLAEAYRRAGQPAEADALTRD